MKASGFVWMKPPMESWRLFRLHRVQGQVRELQAKARMLTTKSDKTEAKPKVLTIQCAIERFLQSLNLKVASSGAVPIAPELL